MLDSMSNDLLISTRCDTRLSKSWAMPECLAKYQKPYLVADMLALTQSDMKS